jgi:hypothetical protein
MDEPAKIEMTLSFEKEFSESDQLHSFLERVKTEDGIWERIWSGWLVIYLPPGSKLDPAKELARIAEKM